ncbi:MAG TPA: Na/Pi cotransporter family protein [Candidatus Deferrimicrobiaceae bacterium]|nr:Na/Pi cotransporter family protein [Candidatus Deferrimicrobiaceae bacterium]
MMDALFLQVIGGVFLLLYGVRLTGQGFELAFGAKLSRLWVGPGGGRFRAFGAGVLSTSLIQSSGAVVAMVVSFTEIAPLSLPQSLAVVLGADLGSTVTIQILSFRIYQYAFLVVSIGVILSLWGRKRTLRAIGQGILGFGLLLLALKFLAGAASEIGSVTSLRLLMADLAQAPLVSFLLGVLLSALFQSGTAVMILLIAFSQQGVLPLPAVLPLVLGANVGGTSLAFTASSGLAAEGRRVAWGHLLMKTVGAALFLPFFSAAQGFLSLMSPDPSRIVANAHTMFNFTLAILFFPLLPRLSSALCRVVPGKTSLVPAGEPAYLDRDHLPATGAALGQVAREIVRMADMIQEMQELGLQAIRSMDVDLVTRIARADDDVDRLTREVKVFLSKLGEGALDPEQTRRAVAYISIVSDLENIGDFLDKTLGEHLRKLAERNQRFSEEGSRELQSLMREVESMYGEAVSAFVTRDERAAEIVIARKKVVGQRERQLRIAHIHRLQKGTPESLESSAAHLDILSSWKVIASHCASIAYNVIQMDA